MRTDLDPMSLLVGAGFEIIALFAPISTFSDLIF